MQASMARFFLSISLLFLTLMVQPMMAQKSKYAATIEMKKGYISGICVLSEEGDTIKGSLFNEFGISAFDFTYLRSSQKVKLKNVIKMLNKWYIKRVLRKDMAHVLDNLQRGVTSYSNDKYHINYQLTRLEDETEE